jgi:serine/threonine-protein kinase
VFDYTGSDGLTIPEGSKVDLKLSLGAIPVVAGLTLDAAKAALKLVGLDVGTVTEEYSDTVPKGNVIEAAPNQLDLAKGSKVDLLVSKGTDQVTLPNVVGQRILAAQDMLKPVGYQKRSLYEPNCWNSSSSWRHNHANRALLITS